MFNAEKNTTTWLGIPLDPLGEIPIYDFISGNQEGHEISRRDTQFRLVGFHSQVVAYIVISTLFMRNLSVAINTLKSQPKNLSIWCSTLVSLLGIGLFIITVLLGFIITINCRHMCWFAITILCLSTIANGIILLHKAYLALLRKRWVAITGMIFVLLQIGFMVVAFKAAPVTIEADIGCVVEYGNLLSYAWIGTVLPVNIFFSAVFSHVAYKQYKTFGSDAWKKLAEGGIQAMCLVVLCNVICGTFIFFKFPSKRSEMFFIIDWAFTSTILVNHCADISKVAKALTEAKSRPEKHNGTRVDIRTSMTTYRDYIHGDTTNFTSLF